jgi:hypothetical protein
MFDCPHLNSAYLLLSFAYVADGQFITYAGDLNSTQLLLSAAHVADSLIYLYAYLENSQKQKNSKKSICLSAAFVVDS